MKRRTKRAFTLVELLIVLLLMGIVYALAFSYLMPKNGAEKSANLTFADLPSIIKSSAKYRKSKLTLYCKDSKECILSANGQSAAETIELNRAGRGYLVNTDETIEPLEYAHVKIGNDEFRPTFIVRCFKDGLFEPSVIRSGDEWFYIHPFGKVYKFSDPVTMVSFMRQSDYLPDRAGYAQ